MQTLDWLDWGGGGRLQLTVIRSAVFWSVRTSTPSDSKSSSTEPSSLLNNEHKWRFRIVCEEFLYLIYLWSRQGNRFTQTINCYVITCDVRWWSFPVSRPVTPIGRMYADRRCEPHYLVSERWQEGLYSRSCGHHVGVACLANGKGVRKGNLGSAELQIVERMSLYPEKCILKLSSAERRSSGWLLPSALWSSLHFAVNWCGQQPHNNRNINQPQLA